MDKELEAIAQVTSTGELRSKFLEADEVKVEIEAILLKRVCFCPLEQALYSHFDLVFYLIGIITFRIHYYKKHLKNGNNARRSSEIFVVGLIKQEEHSNQRISKRNHYVIN